MCEDAIHVEIPAVIDWTKVDILDPEQFAKLVTEAWISPVPHGQILTDWNMMKTLWTAKDYVGVG